LSQLSAQFLNSIFGHKLGADLQWVAMLVTIYIYLKTYNEREVNAQIWLFYAKVIRTAYIAYFDWCIGLGLILHMPVFKHKSFTAAL